MSAPRTFSHKDKVNFGKYRGQTWEELSPVYVAWLAKHIENASIKAQALYEIERRKASR